MIVSAQTRRGAWRVALLLLVAPLGPAALTGWLHPRRPDWAGLAPGESARLLTLGEVRRDHAGALWLDARAAEAYVAAHAPGALPLTEDAWDAQFAGVVDAWDGRRSIVVYCGGESCHASEAVARRLRRELGTENVFVLRGGWEALRQEGEAR